MADIYFHFRTSLDNGRGGLHKWAGYGLSTAWVLRVCLGNGLPLIALRHLVSLAVSMPLRIENRCWSHSWKWRYINVETFNL